jgi:ribosomal protein L37AE/L43A
MYITDLRHFLDAAGAIGPTKGPARTMAQFHADVVAHASNPAGQAPASPRCFKCKKSGVAADAAIVWACPRCRTEGRSNWQGTLWGLRDRPLPRS